LSQIESPPEGKKEKKCVVRGVETSDMKNQKVGDLISGDEMAKFHSPEKNTAGASRKMPCSVV